MHPGTVWSRLNQLLFALAIIVLAFGTTRCFAGLGGENVIVVVNGNSLASRTIANHYVELRTIPDRNIVILDDVPDGIRVSLDDFRDRILKPILAAITKRKLGTQAKVIAYSSGFPTGVKVNEHHNKWENAGLKNIQRPVASLNGLTYFYLFALADNPTYLEMGANLYARQKFEQYFANPFTGELRTRYTDAISQFSTKKFDDAAKSFGALADEHPSLAPIAIRAAEAYAKSGDKESALKYVQQAIRGGWWSKRYLEDNEDLAPFLGDSSLAGILGAMDASATIMQLPTSFSNRKGWTACGFPMRSNEGGMAYMLSCLLAVVEEDASTLDQAVRVLYRAVDADRTYPKGNFRFANSTDVRAKTRFPHVANALLYLNEMGFETEVFQSVLSREPGKVNGMLLGAANVDFRNQVWEFVPGAICESLTSLGGDYTLKRQTKVTSYLHAGAAISSGTVTEPYAIQAKFPLPMMYVYYASGSTAIESFYQAVSSPYQLLIVGDPVCQPFANPPAEWLDISLIPGETKRLRFARRAIGSGLPSTKARSLELYIGGRLIQVTRPANVEIKLPKEASGVGLVRGVLVGASPNEPQISFPTEIDLKGPLPAPVAKITQPRPAAGTDPESTDEFTDGAGVAPITVTVTCAGADSVELKHHGEVVGRAAGDSAEIAVDVGKLGGGPLRFVPIGIFGDKRVRGFSVVDGGRKAEPQ